MTQFQYLGRKLDHIENYCPVVRWNVSKARDVWRRLVKLLQLEGANRRLLYLFCRVVIQSVLLFESYLWAISDVMMKGEEGTHMGFLYQIKVNLERQ